MDIWFGLFWRVQNERTGWRAYWENGECILGPYLESSGQSWNYLVRFIDLNGFIQFGIFLVATCIIQECSLLLSVIVHNTRCVQLLTWQLP
jgi:hypothetical protein